MKLHKIETGNFKLDGGAMFGVVPRIMWQKAYPADENNLCNFSLRSLLIEDEGRILLVDAGVGTKQDEKFFSHYFLNGEDSLERSLEAINIKKTGITDVILTHLHFDHCGGAVERDKDGNLMPAFPNAVYWCSRAQWETALNPNLREKPSFLYENMMPLREAGRLRLFDNSRSIGENIELRLFNGHTNGLAVPFIRYNDTTVVYMTDLIPTSAHVPLSWICGYDIEPLVALGEKELFLKEALKNEYILFFEHDLYTECCTLQETRKGIRVNETFRLEDRMEKAIR